MKKVSRLLLYLLGGSVAVFTVLLLAVNLYVQSRATQTRIEDELSRRLGTRIHFQRISVTPWFGLKLRGITIPQSDSSLGRDFLKADAFRLRIRFLSLFAQELVIKEVSLVHPTVVWAQNKDGKWRIPATPALATSEPVAQPATTVEGSPAAPVEETAPVVAPAPSTGRIAPPAAFTPEVRRVTLSNGNFHFLASDGQPVAAFEGLRFRSSLRHSTELRGNATIAKIALRDRFFLENLTSPVKYDRSDLELSDIHAGAAGGEVTGSFVMQQMEPGSPFTAKVAFRELQADQLVSDAGGPKGMIRGRLEGQLSATGKTADPDALTGAGEIYLRDGEIRKYTLLVALGQILQIDELSQLHFDEAHAKYHIEPGVVIVDELLLTSPNIRVAASGTIGFDGKLQLNSKLAINERIRAQLFRGMRESFQPTAEAGFAAVDFKVSGSVGKPKTDLMSKLVGRDLKDLGGIIKGFLHGGKPKPRRAPVSDTPAEVVAPAAAPTEPATEPAGTP